jgi:threonyl-tRNA synthetase
MKILSLHCDYIKFKPLKKALRSPEELSEKRKKEIQVDETLVIMMAVEKDDEENKELIEEAAKEIKDIAGQVKVKNIVLYPYAHLSPSLSKPDFALKTLERVDRILSKDFKIARAPFGYYKEFELKVKGHPLSELSRDIHFSGELPGEGSEVVEGDVDYKQLLREISKSKLDSRELKDNDHRILAKQMDLFSFSETAPGMVFWHNNGLIIRNALMDFWREEHRKADYEEVRTPQILDKKLWQISGHWDKYKENIFLTDYEKREFAVKPMNCPGGMIIFRNSPKSYKDLPLRVGELGDVHRQELSGTLGGIFRVIQFTQDDAHIYCTEKQLEGELVGVMDLIDKFYDKFGFKFRVELSTRPEKRIGSDKIWDKAEKVLEKVLKKKNVKFKINKGDGAFYGPKIDFHLKDSLGREWQTGTLQLDFAMPERFDLNYIGEDSKEHRPIMLHNTIYGSIERFMGILLEHYSGKLPLWLAPVQVRVINFTDRNNTSCSALVNELKEKGFRVDSDFTSEPVGGKVRKAEVEKVKYIVVIGDKEEKSGELAVRSGGKVENLKRDEFIEKLGKEIGERV